MLTDKTDLFYSGVLPSTGSASSLGYLAFKRTPEQIQAEIDSLVTEKRKLEKENELENLKKEVQSLKDRIESMEKWPNGYVKYPSGGGYTWYTYTTCAEDGKNYS